MKYPMAMNIKFQYQGEYIQWQDFLVIMFKILDAGRAEKKEDELELKRKFQFSFERRWKP